jgi:putative ABC transport system permease protein
MIWSAFVIAVREIRRNLGRAILTVLGVIIGVAAVITLVTLGQGATTSVHDQISSLGSNLFTLRPGAGYGARAAPAGVPRFSEKDAEAIREQVAGVAAVAPIASSSLSTIYRQNSRYTVVTGTSPDYFPINRWDLADGRFFTEAELRTGAPVCVIGSTVRDELFGAEDPIGHKIRIGKASCEVVGLLATKGQVLGSADQNDTIVAPLSTVRRRLLGKSSERDISQISVSASDASSLTAVIADVTSLMRQRRGLQADQDNNFNIFDTRQLSDTLGGLTGMLTMLMGAIAGVSLLVGGIGIMNIMLVSVTERTREIGIRLAIGGTAGEVLWQFLIEAITLSCVGGLVGIAVALPFCLGLCRLLQVPFVFNPQINAIAFLFSGTVGVAFGFAPARRAARLDPIEALRYE